MTTSPDPIDRVRGALDALADALVTGTPDDVLAVEATLASAVSALQAATLPSGASVDALRRRLLDLRLRVERCERLGGALAELAPIDTPSTAYGRTGRTTTADVPVGFRAGGGRG